MINRFTYTILLYITMPLIFIYFLYRAIKSPDYREGFTQRLALYPEEEFELPIIHCHCASLGEVKAALPLLKRIVNDYSEHRLVVTTTTPTGAREIRNQFGDKVYHCYSPFDTPGATKAFCKKFNPVLSLFVEVELWPNWLHALKGNGSEIVLVNGRLSLNSFTKYQTHKRLMTPAIQCFSKLLVQYESDAHRFIDIGANEDQVFNVGNIKFDLDVPEESAVLAEQLREQIGQRKAWIAASTHKGEHELALAIHKKLLKEMPSLLLIIVPRHPEQFDYARTCIEKYELTYVTRSSQEAITNQQNVLLGDTMGEMLGLMRLATVAFVGGSWAPKGGHNPLEPAALDIPVVMGPNIANIKDIAAELIQYKALRKFDNANEAYSHVETLIADTKVHKQASQACHTIMQANKGGIDKTFSAIQDYIT